MSVLEYKEIWAQKNWCFWTVVLEKTLESPLDCKEIQPVHPKGDQSWVFTGRTDVTADTPILWPPHVKTWLTGKQPDAGGDWGQEEKGMSSLTQWKWVWVDSGSWWWTGRPGVLRFMGSKRAGHEWETELNWTEMSSFYTPKRSVLIDFFLPNKSIYTGFTYYKQSLAKDILLKIFLLKR